MAKKITAVVKLQLPAGKATPGPPVGSTLGPHGINIAGFTKEFNEKNFQRRWLDHPGYHHHLSRPLFHFCSQDPAGPRAHQESMRFAKRIGSPQQDESRNSHQRATS